jgi:hypothetical protein
VDERERLVDALRWAQTRAHHSKQVAEAARIEANKRELFARDAVRDYDEAQRRLIEFDTAKVIAARRIGGFSPIEMETGSL